MEKWILLIVFVVAAIVMFFAMPSYINNDTEKKKKYKNLENIESIPDEELETAVVEWLFSRLDEKGTTEVPIMRAMPKPCRSVYATYVVTGEVMSEGFEKCLSYIDSYILSSAIEGFIDMGAEELADITERACGIAGDFIAVNGRERLPELADNEAVKELTLGFKTSSETEKLSDTLVAYIRNNQSCFGV